MILNVDGYEPDDLIQLDVPTLQNMSYSDGTAAFMSLHKATITLTPIMSLATVFIQNKSL